MLVITLGRVPISSSVSPRASAVISIASRARPPPMPVAKNGLSDSVRLTSVVSRWRLCAGRSVGAVAWLPKKVSTLKYWPKLISRR